MGISTPLPQFPDLAVVAEFVRLAAAYDTARAVRLPEGRSWRDADGMQWPLAERDAALDYLDSQTGECKAAIYAAYRVGTPLCSDADWAAETYRRAFNLAMQPHHRRYAAVDLIGEASLAERVCRGIGRLGLRLEAAPARESGDACHRSGGRTSGQAGA